MPVLRTDAKRKMWQFKFLKVDQDDGFTFARYQIIMSDGYTYQISPTMKTLMN